MKILVTGSSGTIGTRLCEKLMEANHEVVGADWEPNNWNPAIAKITINADLRDENACDVLPTDIELIIHLAANARVYELVENPDRARDNILSTFNTLEYARKNNIKKFMFASSREAYGNTDIEILSEDKADFANCESPYTASKISGEALTEAYKRCYGIDSIIFRFSNVYGMYDNSVRVVPLFIRQARAGETLTIFGKDKCLDFTYIDDTVHGIIQGVEKFDTAKNETYNLAYGEGATILHLAERIIELTGSTSTIELGDVRTGEIVKYTADISKAKKHLGFDPQISFDKGIEKAVEWYKENT
ncbi:MAG: NAD-dependent epimerase/dehydratase family protein [bacterium]|nr:NAD-dependent epimerase/dehydratase family protein [bacterium]